MTRVARKIQRHITVGELDGLSTTVDRMHKLSPTTHGIKRESTGITEHIQHLLACRETLQESTVLTLVNEETGLLASQPVDIEHQSILYSRIIIRAAIEEAVLHIIHERQRGLALVIHILNTGTHHTHQLLGYLHTTEVHADAMSLHDGSLTVNIDDKPRQMVALAVNETIGVVLRIIGDTDGLTHG